MFSNKSSFNLVKASYLLFVIVLSVGLYSLYSNLESHIIEEDKGFKGEALTNDYLAAEYFLLRMGQSAQKIKLFSSNHNILQDNDILLVPNVRLSFDRLRSEEMIKWVEGGGHLIITGEVAREKLTKHSDFILNSLGIFIDRKVLEEGSQLSDYPVNVTSLDDESFLQVNFDDYLVIETTSGFDSVVTWQVEDDDRIHAMQIKLGAGRLTLLSDMRMFKNYYIENYDHAAFLFSLTQQLFSDPKKGVFYYSLFDDSLSLFEWLWEYAQLLVVSLLLLLIIILWMIIPRFGPLINAIEPVRRQFMNHLSAAGNYHWRQGHYNQLLMDVRMKLSQDIKYKYPEWTALSRQDRIEHFSEISQLEKQKIEMALFSVNIQSQNEFISVIKILEILRKNI